MKTFKDLQTEWQHQTEVEVPQNGAERIMGILSNIRKRQRWTNRILGATALGLIVFFFYISGYEFQTVTIGLSLMIGALFVRIALEVFSLRRLRRMDPLNEFRTYRERMIRYYDRRRMVHLVITPLIILIYAFGFWLLLPSFKANLSTGFYRYILISSMVVLLVLGFIIGKQIRDELRILKGLKR